MPSGVPLRRPNVVDGSVPAAGLGGAPGAARRAVPAIDVVEAPLDLRGRVGPPVTAVSTHLRTRQRLRDPVGTGRRVVGPVVPAGFLCPQRVQARELALTPAVLLAGESAGDGSRVTRVGTGGRPSRTDPRLPRRCGSRLSGVAHCGPMQP